jgi:CheY-like chemotaxis protein
MRERRFESGDASRVAELETERRRLEAELEREREANRRKDEFLAILSHEMRSPLNAVLTWVQVLRSGRVDAATTEQALASLERSARLQARMIEDLLDTSRIISGKLSIEIQEADLATIVKSAVDVAAAAARDKQVALDYAVDTKPLPIRGDAVRLQQVVGNLLSNAVKFTASGGKVSVTLRTAGNWIEIEVKDSGQGISPDLLPHIFDPFRQGDVSITRRHGGLGLGLAIAKHLVELHGGTIRAESDGEGCGTKFVVRMKLAEAPPRRNHDAAESRHRGETILAGLRVLLVDDDPDTRMAIGAVLREAGSHVDTAQSVDEALAAFGKSPASVVVTDLAMPGSDGFELMNALRATEKGRAVPVIALTGSVASRDRQRVRDAGFALHLTKPVDPADVIGAVAMAASGRARPLARRRSQ